MEKLVFIVDDDAVYLNFMKHHFQQMNGYKVELFKDGKQALAELPQKKPDLIILDHHLGNDERNGIYYLKQIKKLRSSPPTMLITANTTHEVKKQALKAGAETVIVKSDAFLVQLRTAIDEINTNKQKNILSRLFKK
jgi:DNA-binding response OmpR family regulator